MQLGAAREQCFRPQDVARRSPARRMRNAGVDARPPGDARGRDAASASAGSASLPPPPIRWPQKSTTPGPASAASSSAIDAAQPADEPQLPPRRGERAVVAAVTSRRRARARPGVGRRRRAATAPRPRWRRPSRTRRLRGEQLEHGARHSRERSPRVAGDQPQRRRVDRRVVAAGAREHRVVQLGAPARPAGAASRRPSASAASLAMRARRRGDVLVVDRAEAIADEAPRRLLGGSRAGQREHRSVLEGDVARMLGQAALGEIERGQQLASALLAPHGFEPFIRAATRETP